MAFRPFFVNGTGLPHFFLHALIRARLLALEERFGGAGGLLITRGLGGLGGLTAGFLLALRFALR